MKVCQPHIKDLLDFTPPITVELLNKRCFTGGNGIGTQKSAILSVINDILKNGKEISTRFAILKFKLQEKYFFHCIQIYFTTVGFRNTTSLSLCSIVNFKIISICFRN